MRFVTSKKLRYIKIALTGCRVVRRLFQQRIRRKKSVLFKTSHYIKNRVILSHIIRRFDCIYKHSLALPRKNPPLQFVPLLVISPSSNFTFPCLPLFKPPFLEIPLFKCLRFSFLIYTTPYETDFFQIAPLLWISLLW